MYYSLTECPESPASRGFRLSGWRAFESIPINTSKYLWDRQKKALKVSAESESEGIP
jgi:hypothetical protein